MIYLKDVATLKYYPEKCTGCGRCEEVCRFDAVKLTQEYELASKTKEELITSIRRKI